MKAARCTRCRLHLSLCLCADLPALQTRTRLTLVVHHQELRRPSNTGMLAVHCLTNAEAFVRGKPGDVLSYEQVLRSEQYQNILLYPSASAKVLEKDWALSFSKPVRLLVPDGNWGQGSRTATRLMKTDDNLVTAILPQTKPTQYRLRKELHPGGLATFEAIARALGILEGIELQEKLEHIFRRMIERQLFMRGQLRKEEVYGGI